MKLIQAIILGCIFFAANFSRAEDASSFPSHQVRLIVPYPAGGNSDAIARTIGIKLAQIWNQPVVIENKPGGDSIIGTSYVARAPADGYTILTNISLIVQNTLTKEKLPFDTFKELRPLIAATETPMYFVVSQQEHTPRTLAEFIQQAKEKPGAFSFGSFGNGSTGHLLLLALEKSASIDVTHVPYKGSGDVITQLLGGQVSSSFLPWSVISPHLASGKVRILAATGDKRPPMSPNVPIFEELGIKGFTASQWNGFFIASNTPSTIVKKLSTDMNSAIHSPEVVEKLKSLGLSPVGGSPEEFQAMIDKDFDLIRSALKDHALQLN